MSALDLCQTVQFRFQCCCLNLLPCPAHTALRRFGAASTCEQGWVHLGQVGTMWDADPLPGTTIPPQRSLGWLGEVGSSRNWPFWETTSGSVVCCALSHTWGDFAAGRLSSCPHHWQNQAPPASQAKSAFASVILDCCSISHSPGELALCSGVCVAVEFGS